MIRSGVNCHLEFQRSWLLSLFAEDDSWNCRGELVPLLNQVHSEVSRPMLLLALGAAGQSQWFRSNRRRLLSMNGWERRTFIKGALAMSSDEYKHWIHSVLPSLQPLDAAVAQHCLTIIRQRNTPILNPSIPGDQNDEENEPPF